MSLHQRTTNSETQPLLPKPTLDHGIMDPSGWGKREKIIIPPRDLEQIQHKLSKPFHKLGEIPATAICGNDSKNRFFISAALRLSP